MTMKVKVLDRTMENEKTDKIEENKVKILTPKYIKELNRGISMRMISSEVKNEIATRNLKKRIFR